MKNFICVGFNETRMASHASLFKTVEAALLKEKRIRAGYGALPLFECQEDFVIIDGDRPISLVLYDINIIKKKNNQILVFMELEKNFLALTRLESQEVYISYMDKNFTIVAEAWARSLPYRSRSLDRALPLYVRKLTDKEKSLILYSLTEEDLETLAAKSGYKDGNIASISRKRLLQSLGLRNLKELQDLILDLGDI